MPGLRGGLALALAASLLIACGEEPGPALGDAVVADSGGPETAADTAIVQEDAAVVQEDAAPGFDAALDGASDPGSEPDAGSDLGPASDPGFAPDLAADVGGASDPGPVDAGPAPTCGPLSLPAHLALPYVDAGAGSASATLSVTNAGDAPCALTVSLAGDPALSLTAPPDSVAAGATVDVTVSFAGAAAEGIVEGALTVAWDDGAETVDVWAVAGDPAIGQGSWEALAGPGGLALGEGITVAMPTAPFPDASGSWTDPSVHVFLPASWRAAAPVHVALHFHGHGATLADTVATHRYREQTHASGADVVLVVPQGPVEASSGNFGKLMAAGGVEALVDQVLVLLYRDGRLTTPRPGDLVLTSHSGGYQAVRANLATTTAGGDVVAALMFDSIYAYESDFAAFVTGGGGLLRSSYTVAGGTVDNNATTLSLIEAGGVPVATAPTQVALRDEAAVIYASDVGHSDVTRAYTGYGELLRWVAPRGRRGPRVELREATATAGEATVRWLSPPDEALEGFRVELDTGGGGFEVVATAAADASEASFPLPAPGAVRVRPVAAGIAGDAGQPSDTGFVASDASVLVVDGFDRVLGGSFAGLAHDFAARVGAAAGGAATVSNEALTEEDGFDASGFATVLWLLGDEGTGDRTFTDAEQAWAEAYVAGGGRLIVSGSEIGWDLGAQGHGAAFLSGTLGATYVADDAGALSVTGAGALAGLGAVTFGGPAAPYVEDYPDVLAPAAGAEVLLVWPDGQAAAVGRPGEAVVIGFPLELVDDPAQLAALVSGLLAF